MAYLLVYEGDSLREQRELNAARISIGRSKDNDIVLANPHVSGHHAVIECEGEAYTLVDNSSANGSFINGKKIEQRQSLELWQDIRIQDFVLKFRPRARLPGEQEGKLSVPDVGQERAATQAIDVSKLGDLAKSRQRKSPTYCLLMTMPRREGKYPLTKVNFTIGRDKACDIRVRGWFVPQVAAHIKRQSDGFYLFPKRRGKVRVNGGLVSEPTQLSEGDTLEVRNLSMLFCSGA
jgi:pSer/pThr/pTyr-binding forkhead associated (FHA) protein